MDTTAAPKRTGERADYRAGGYTVLHSRATLYGAAVLHLLIEHPGKEPDVRQLGSGDVVGYPERAWSAKPGRAGRVQ